MHTKKIQHFAEAAFWPAALLRRTSVLAESQNLGAGGIHFRRAFESPKGGGRLRLPEPKEKGLPDRKPFLFGARGGT